MDMCLHWFLFHISARRPEYSSRLFENSPSKPPPAGGRQASYFSRAQNAPLPPWTATRVAPVHEPVKKNMGDLRLPLLQVKVALSGPASRFPVTWHFNLRGFDPVH